MSTIKSHVLADALTDEYNYIVKNSDESVMLFKEEPTADVEKGFWVDSMGDIGSFIMPVNISWDSDNWQECIVKKEVEIKIDTVGRYMTRGGTPAYISSFSTEGTNFVARGVIDNISQYITWFDNGKVYTSNMDLEEYEIVSKIEDVVCPDIPVEPPIDPETPEEPTP